MAKIPKIILFASILLLVFSFNTAAQENGENQGEKTFRNPFVEYVETVPKAESDSNKTAAQRSEPVITLEDIKRGVPFRLDGIITSGSKKVAVVYTGDGVEFIRESFQKNNYYISAVNQDSITIKNRGFTFQLRIGGKINER
jgi:type II secretory pathway component PulC